MSFQMGESQNPGYPHTRPSAPYPTFLPFLDTAQLHAGWALRGLIDASRWDVVARIVLEDAEIRSNVIKSALLNSLSLASIYLFDLVIIPILGRSTSERWLHRNIGSIYQALWLLPVVGASLYLNSSWCSLIGKRVYALQHGRRAAPPPTSYTGMLTAVATSAYRVILIGSTVILTFTLEYIPYLGPWLGFIFMCWVDSYYCFEFIWTARGMSLSQRVRHEEERWAYYFAFGFPSAVLCMWGSSLGNAAIFALIYPSHIIMAMHSQPVPTHPYTPVLPRGDLTIHPSPFIPIRVPIFALVIKVNDIVVKILSVSAGGGRRRNRGPVGTSTTEMEVIEEGIADRKLTRRRKAD